MRQDPVCVCVHSTDEWLRAGCGNQRSGVRAWVQRGFKAAAEYRCIQNGFTPPFSANTKRMLRLKEVEMRNQETTGLDGEM